VKKIKENTSRRGADTFSDRKFGKSKKLPAGRIFLSG
jgi:hypothetical protein